MLFELCFPSPPRGEGQDEGDFKSRFLPLLQRGNCIGEGERKNKYGEEKCRNGLKKGIL